MKKKPTILLTGPILPPVGGISVHLHRLTQLLQSDFTIDLIDESAQRKKQIFNIRSLHLVGYLLKIRGADLLFIHSGNRVFKKLHLFFGWLFRKKMITTIHGYGAKRNVVARSIDSFFINRCQFIILVNESIYDKLDLQREKCTVHHPFIPPVMAAEPPLDAELTDWIEQQRAKKRTICVSNASRLDDYEGGDLYGLDQILAIAKQCAQQQKPFSFIYVVTSLEKGSNRFSNASEFIKMHHLDDHCLLLHRTSLSFVRLAEAADVMIRPTLTDGDALSVREALHVGKSVIASDAVSRPDGVITYRTGHTDDLLNKLENRPLGVTSTFVNDQTTQFYHQIIHQVLQQ